MGRLLALTACGTLVSAVALCGQREPQLTVTLELLGPMNLAAPAIFRITMHPDGKVVVSRDCRDAGAWPAAQQFCQVDRVHVSAAGRARVRALLLREQFFERRCCVRPVDLGERRIRVELDRREHFVGFLDLDDSRVAAPDAKAVLRVWYGVLAEVTKDGKISMLPEDKRALARK